VKFKHLFSTLGFINKEEIIANKPKKITCNCGEITASYATDANYNHRCLKCHDKEMNKDNLIQ